MIQFLKLLIFGKNPYSVKEILGAKKDLRDFTEEELYAYLERNQGPNEIPATALACICSEILRRQLKPTKR